MNIHVNSGIEDEIRYQLKKGSIRSYGHIKMIMSKTVSRGAENGNQTNGNCETWAVTKKWKNSLRYGKEKSCAEYLEGEMSKGNVKNEKPGIVGSVPRS